MFYHFVPLNLTKPSVGASVYGLNTFPKKTSRPFNESYTTGVKKHYESEEHLCVDYSVWITLFITLNKRLVSIYCKHLLVFIIAQAIYI